MVDIADSMRRLTVTATSPDRTVRGTWSVAAGLVVAFDKSIEDRHGESGIARQVEPVLTGLADGMRRAREKVCEESLADGPDTGWNHPTMVGLRREYLEFLESVEATGESPRGHVVVTCFGNRQFEVDIASGSLNRIDPVQLAAEVGGAVNLAIHQRDIAGLEAFRKGINERG